MSLTAERSTNKSIPFLSTDNYSHIPRQYLNFTIENTTFSWLYKLIPYKYCIMFNVLRWGVKYLPTKHIFAKFDPPLLRYPSTHFCAAGLTFPFCLLRADQTNQSQLRASLGRVNSAQAVQYVIVMVSSDDGEGYGEANWHLHSVTELEYGRVQLP